MRTANLWFRNTMLALLVAPILFVTPRVEADNSPHVSEIAQRLDASAKVLDEVMNKSSTGVSSGGSLSVIQRAQCVAIFPGMVEVAALVGGKHGEGFMSCRTRSGWSAPAPLDVTGGNWGAQFGAEKVDLVVIIMNQKGERQLEAGKIDVGIEASGVAGTAGTHHWTMNSDVVTYARAKGVFAGTNLDGSSFSQDTDDTRSLYGRNASLSDILNGQIKDTRAGTVFVSKVAYYAGKGRPRD